MGKGYSGRGWSDRAVYTVWAKSKNNVNNVIKVFNLRGCRAMRVWFQSNVRHAQTCPTNRTKVNINGRGKGYNLIGYRPLNISHTHPTHVGYRAKVR